jgi:hypothetical protein
MIKLKTLLMEADAPKLKDTEKEKAKKLGLVWKGKGYGKEGDDGITHKNDGGKLVKIDKDGGKEDPKSKGLSGSDFDRELPSDDDGMEPSDLSDFDPAHDEPKGFNGVDYGKMKGKEPGAFDRNAVSNLLSDNPELEKELGVKSSDDYDKQQDVLGKLDLEKISKIIDKYGDDDDKESHIERLKDDHGLESGSDSEDSKPYSAKDEIDDAIDQGDGDGARELFDSEIGFKKMGKEGKEAKALLDRLSDYEYGLIDLDDKEQDDIKDRLKQLSNKYLGGDKPEEEKPKSAKETSRERVKTAQDLDDMEKIKKDPMGTLNKMDELIQGVMGELEDNEDADEEYSILDDEFGYRVYQLEDELQDAIDDAEPIEDLHDEIKELTSDFERFMDVNYRKVAGISKPKKFSSGGGSFLGYGTAGKSGGFYNDNVNIKLKDIMRESKVSYLVINEALQSKLLRKFTNRQDFKLDNDFYGWLARLGIRADKVTDDMIEKTAKLSGKGVVIAVTGKKVSLPAKGKSYWRSDLEVDKGVVLSVFKDGKAVWWTKSYRESEKNRKKDIRVADTKGYGFSTSENRTFGLNQFGYQNAASVKKINGVEFYKISLEENMPYMGGKEVRKLRSDIQVGSWKWRDDESFKRQNRDKYEDAIKAMYDDPEKVKAKVKKAKDYTDGLITGLIGGKPNAAAKKLLKGLSSTRAPEMQAMELMKDITDAMDRLYDKVTYYNNAVKDDIDYEKRNPEHPKSYRNSPRYGKEVSHIVNLILKNKFRGYY